MIAVIIAPMFAAIGYSLIYLLFGGGLSLEYPWSTGGADDAISEILRRHSENEGVVMLEGDDDAIPEILRWCKTDGGQAAAGF